MEELPVLMANATRSYRSRLSSKKFSPSQTRTSGSEALRNFNCGNIQTSFKNSSGLVYRLQQRKRVWTQKFRTEGAGKLIQLGFSKLEVGNPTPVAAHHGLDQVLFSQGVHSVDSISSWLKSIHQPAEIDYNAIPQFVPPSQDEELLFLAQKHDCQFIASTSSSTAAMSHIYYLFSKFKRNNVTSLPTFANSEETQFAFSAGIPSTMMIRPRTCPNTGTKIYAIDSYKWVGHQETILLDLGKSLECMLTTTPEKFAKNLLLQNKQDFFKPPVEQAQPKPAMDSFHYLKGGNLLIRSQLDCYHPKLSRKVFDLKTRATRAIRTNLADYKGFIKDGKIRSVTGVSKSFEREYFDMIRSAFLKYIFQVRIGQMDGIFVAFHNTRNIYGFEYIALEEMERTIFETPEMADLSFKVCLQALNQIINTVTSTCKEEGEDTTLRVTLGSREGWAKREEQGLADIKGPHLFVFVEKLPKAVDQGWEDTPKGIVGISKLRKFCVYLETTISGIITSGQLLLDEGDDPEVWLRIVEDTETPQEDLKHELQECSEDIQKAQGLADVGETWKDVMEDEEELRKLAKKDDRKRAAIRREAERWKAKLETEKKKVVESKISEPEIIETKIIEVKITKELDDDFSFFNNEEEEEARVNLKSKTAEENIEAQRQKQENLSVGNTKKKTDQKRRKSLSL